MIINVGNKIKQGLHPHSLYLSIEGADGIGKTTLTKYFTNYLLNKNKKVLSIREPGQAGVAGQVLRQHILSQERSLEEQIELFRADRILTQELFVKPAMVSDTIVISDRSLLSSLIYQGWMSNQPEKVRQIYKLYQALPHFVFPDLTIVGVVPPEVALQRIQERSQNKGEVNYFDDKNQEYHATVRQYFNNADVWYSHPVTHIDFNRSLEDITTDIVKTIHEVSGIEL